MSPTFLTVESVAAIHQMQLDEFGGSPGIRDQGLLESAVSQASATFGDDLADPDRIHELGISCALSDAAASRARRLKGSWISGQALSFESDIGQAFQPDDPE